MTKEEKFAIESADRIHEELCESDGFHQDDEMPTVFIAGVMVTKEQEIKTEIRKQILNDLRENPEAFQYGGKTQNDPIYDSGMREDYEGLVTEFIRKQFNSDKTKTVYICPQCQSDNVQIKAWVRPNENNQYVDEVNEGDEAGWCDDEQLPTFIETAEVNADAKVIGFQVVGEDGTAQEGEIHPDMDASFCVYSLKQAQSMIGDNNHGDEQWRLLTIWTGDIEEPTMMFKGDPRD